MQTEILRMVTAAPWYVKSYNIHKDLNVPFVGNNSESYFNGTPIQNTSSNHHDFAKRRSFRCSLYHVVLESIFTQIDDGLAIPETVRKTF